MGNPDGLLLDEPFNAIDDENFNIVIELMEYFKKNNSNCIPRRY